MKKLNKLQINSEKLIKNEELILLRGGYDYNCCICYDDMTPMGYMAAWNAADCWYQCDYMGWGWSWGSGGMGNC
jgi:hypothetical protein